MLKHLITDVQKYDEYRKNQISIISEIYDNNINFYKNNTQNCLDLIGCYSPASKNYHFSKREIFEESLNISFNKIKDFNLILNALLVNCDYSKYVEKSEKFSINIMNESTTYAYCIRSDLSNSKGVSTLYSLLNFMNKNNFDTSIPIDIRYSSGEPLSISNYHYFKIIKNNGGGTHRLAGICKGLGLLQDCFIDMDYVIYEDYYKKEDIDKTIKFIEKINSIDYINFIGFEKFNNNCIEIELKDEKKCSIAFKNNLNFIDFVLDSRFEKFLIQIQNIYLKILYINENQIKIILPNSNEDALSIYNKENEIYIYKIINKIYLSYMSYVKTLKKSLYFKLIQKTILVNKYVHPDYINNIKELGRALSYLEKSHT